MRPLRPLTITAALLCAAPALAQTAAPPDPRRRIEATEALAETAERSLSALYRGYLRSAERLPEPERARAWSLFFLGRCARSAGRATEARGQLLQARDRFADLGEEDLAAVCGALGGAGEAPGAWGRILAAEPRAPIARLKRLAEGADALALLDLGALLAAGPIDGERGPALAAILERLERRPEKELVVGVTVINQRRLEDRLSFYDPLRIRLKLQVQARQALADARLGALDRAWILASMGRLDDALEAARRASGPKAQMAQAWIHGKASRPEAAAESWRAALAADPGLAAAVLRQRALLGIGLERALAETEALLTRRRESSGEGSVGLRRFRGQNRALLWSLALLRARSGRPARAGLDARAALEIAEDQFPAGRRGDWSAHEDPRFPFLLGELYVQAHRYRDALSYLYDPEAVLERYPEAALVRAALVGLSAMEAVGTDDARAAEGPGEAAGDDALLGPGSREDYRSLIREEGSLEGEGQGRGAEPSRALILIGVGVALLGLAAWKLRSA